MLIPTYNRCHDLEECIKSLLNMTVRPHEIIVIDDDSTDGTKRLKETYPIRYISIRKRSRQAARNAGFSVAEGEVIAFLDDDVVVCEEWSKHILEPYRDDRVGGVGGRVIPYDKPITYFVKMNKLNVGKVYRDGLVLGNFDAPLSNCIEVDHLPGCDMSFRRSLLIKIGGFDENFKGNCFRDDTDVCMRIKKLGYKLIYQPKAVVRHKFMGRNIDSQWVYWYIRNCMYFYFKNIFPSAQLFFIPFLFRLVFLPQDYIKKSQIHIQPSLMLPLMVIKGFVDGFFTLKLACRR